MGTGQDQTGEDRSKGWMGAEAGLLSTTSTRCWLLRAGSCLCSEPSPSGWPLPHNCSSTSPPCPTWALQLRGCSGYGSRWHNPAYCSGSAGLAPSPYSLSACPPLAWLHTLPHFVSGICPWFPKERPRLPLYPRSLHSVQYSVYENASA